MVGRPCSTCMCICWPDVACTGHRADAGLARQMRRRRLEAGVFASDYLLLVRRRRRWCRPHHDHPRSVPIRVAPRPPRPVVTRAETGAPERVVETGRVTNYGGAFRPQVNHVGFHSRIGVIIVAHLLRYRAVQGAGDGHFAPAREYFRIIETVAASDESPLAFPSAAGLRACLAVQWARQQVETGLLRARLGLDDFTPPAHTGSTGATLLGTGGGYIRVGAFERLGYRRTSAQQGECGDDGDWTVRGHGTFSIMAKACAFASALI